MARGPTEEAALNSFTVALVRCCFVAVAILAAALPAHAGKSHLGQKPEDFITLTAVNVGGTTACPYWQGYEVQQLGSDGAPSGTAFLVPEGKRLVVTDLAWSVIGSPTSILPNRTMTLWIATSAPSAWPIYQAAEQVSSAIDTGEFWSGQDHLVSGFSIGAGLTLCTSAFNESYTSGISTNTATRLVVQGYLIRSK